MRSIDTWITAVLMISSLAGVPSASLVLVDDPPSPNNPSDVIQGDAGKGAGAQEEPAPAAEAADIQERGVLPGLVTPGATLQFTAPTLSLTAKPKPECGPTKYQLVRALATASAPEVRIDCSLTLLRTDVVTKRLIFEGAEASGVTVECNGATIDGKNFLLGYDRLNDKSGFMSGFAVAISSRPTTPDPVTGLMRFEPPQNVTLRNCKIIGPVKVYGTTGEGVETARRSDYVQRIRNHAPRNIVFDQVTIEGLGADGAVLYIFSGVSNFQLLNSTIMGNTGDVVIYLDAESYRNTFRNNVFDAATSSRETMAIDGSSYNTIINNHFRGTLNHGGIYLYRNCGESGQIRHSTPSGNTIINNFFYYDKYEGDNPAIYVGSRNGRSSKSYDCDDDEKYPGCCQYGSSVSNYDHAKFNVVMQNQIRKRSVSDMIRVNRPNDINTPNYINYNETVTAKIERKAGCYISNGNPHVFILDGKSYGDPIRSGYRYTCHDGVLSPGLPPLNVPSGSVQQLTPAKPGMPPPAGIQRRGVEGEPPVPSQQEGK